MNFAIGGNTWEPLVQFPCIQCNDYPRLRVILFLFDTKQIVLNKAAQQGCTWRKPSHRFPLCSEES